MAKFSDNYYLRGCFLKREQVPTQSVMIKTMSPPLAAVYFKSMTPKLKVLAGLEPPMKGGGTDWFIPPKELLEEGRAVMKPFKKSYLSKLNFLGIDHFGMQLVEVHRRRMQEERDRLLLESDVKWKNAIDIKCRQQWDETSREAALNNTEKIKYAFREFTSLFMTSIGNIETLLFQAAINEIKGIREETFRKMSERYETYLKYQATELYDKYTNKLMKEKARLKTQFIDNVEKTRSQMVEYIHDINVEKHIAVEKLRQYLNCQNLACQIYVALKEREECKKEMEVSIHEHQKKVKFLTEQIALQDFEIFLAKEKEKKRHEFNRIWQKKVCHVVKKFQLFVSYCLNTLPEYADFFINMEKLMLLQLNEALNNPSTPSIFEEEPPKFHTPVPNPHLFYLFCDKGYKAHLDQNLCPKHCTSSASQLPAIIINKRCIYAACDNFVQFTEKIKDYLRGERGTIIDNHIYEHDVPVQCTPSMELAELKLESSLFQILQQERPNIKAVPVDCCFCKIKHCFCSPLHASEMSLSIPKTAHLVPSVTIIPPGNKIKTRSAELKHEREPKWESYLNYVAPTRCKCPKTAKKHLSEHLPPYMRNMSDYESPELPEYEMCSMSALKKLVMKAQGRVPTPPPPPRVPSRTKDVSTQYSDQEFDLLCTCFSDEEIAGLFKDLTTGSKLFDQSRIAPRLKIVGESLSHTDVARGHSEFATDRAYSLRNLIEGAPELKEIFMKKQCDFH